MDNTAQNKFTKSLSPFAVWAFALGSSIGWGSLIVTSSNYLSQAGPLGSVLGLIVGMLVMLIIARNYSYMMQIYPDAGGAYTFSREVFSHDQGFLTGWFLLLVYMAILWANATSLPLFARKFIGDIFQFGKMYTIFGYDVYLGETLLTIAAIAVIAILCISSRKVTAHAMTVLVCIFVVAIVVVFVVAITGDKTPADPAFIPDSSAFNQVVQITVITPWAFIGFESISHRTEEFSFNEKKIFRIFVIATISITALYIFITLVSVTTFPERYGTWIEYINDIGNLEGLEAIPTFYAAYRFMGDAGVWILMAALLALVISSLIGIMTSVSRLMYAMSKDNILPKQLGELNKSGTPSKAIILIALIAMVIAFVGRTAIGWIVDVTTIGSMLIYGLVSASVIKTANVREDKIEKATGIAGLVLMIIYGAIILFPNFLTTGSIERESYFIFIMWSILGFIVFRIVIGRDKEKRFGTSAIVWVALLALVLVLALIWMRQSMLVANNEMLDSIKSYYADMADTNRAADAIFIEKQMDKLEADNITTIIMAFGMFAFAIAIMIVNHIFMSRRTRESEMIANIDPMTGVKSKHAWLSKEREVNNALAAGKMEDFSIVVCDVNGLKKINDTLGHKAGDEYICSASRMVCNIFKHSPVYRIGGDEFVLVLTGGDREIREDLMKLLHDSSAENIKSGGVVVSGGISDFDPQKDSSFHDVFSRADALMYKEKQLLKSMGAVTRE